MKEYALVYTDHFMVVLYASWLENQQGVVMETSDDREYLEGEAEARNIEAGEEDNYEDERLYDEN